MSTSDAASVAREIMSMSGLEALQAMVAGRIPAPSIATTLGFRLAGVGEGWSVFEGEPSERILNPLGVVHGGFALTLIDSCTGCAV
ncbi:MAG TPA: PaaI family thioesterase, partial [Sinorhizobium sp.]|nr:PaaI family thioesterase [Sinorhizobium sp.]